MTRHTDSRRIIIFALIASLFFVFNARSSVAQTIGDQKTIAELEGRFHEVSTRQWVGGTGSQRIAAEMMDTHETVQTGFNLVGAKHVAKPDSSDVTEETIWGGWIPPKCICSEPIRPPLCHNPDQERDDCIGVMNSCFGACGDREDVKLPSGSRVDRSCFGNAFYIAYGLGCMPVQIGWRILSWPLQGSWNCCEDVCAELNACTIMFCRKEPRFGLEVTGLCCSESCNIECKRASYLGSCYCPPCGGHKVREDRSASKIRESRLPSKMRESLLPPQQEEGMQ